VAYELSHHLNARRILHDRESHSVLAEQFFGTQKILIFTDDHVRDSVQQTGSSTHHAGTERTDQRQLRPITPPAGIADADDLGMRRRIAALHTQVVAPGYDASLRVGEHRSNRQPTLA